MTFEQIKFTIAQIQKFEDQKGNTNQRTMQSLITECISYFTDIDLKSMWFYSMQFPEKNNTQDMYIFDCDQIIFRLKGVLDSDSNYPIARIIIEDIEACRNAETANEIEDAIRRIAISYSDRIHFHEEVSRALATMSYKNRVSCVGNKTMLMGMMTQLENYAVDLCCGKIDSGSNTNERVVVNFSNVATATNNVNIDITAEIENAIKRVEDACLPDAQEKEVLAKIQELKDIIESKESKGNRWAKIKYFFKWVAEQGIQVASIIVPLLVTTIK